MEAEMEQLEQQQGGCQERRTGSQWGTLRRSMGQVRALNQDEGAMEGMGEGVTCWNRTLVAAVECSLQEARAEAGRPCRVASDTEEGDWTRSRNTRGDRIA